MLKIINNTQFLIFHKYEEQGITCYECWDGKNFKDGLPLIGKRISFDNLSISLTEALKQRKEVSVEKA